MLQNQLFKNFPKSTLRMYLVLLFKRFTKGVLFKNLNIKVHYDHLTKCTFTPQ